MSQKRPTYSRKSAVRLVPLYDALINQLATDRPKGMFVSCDDFGVAVNTLSVRFSDGLLWLTKHNVDDKLDKRADYQKLKDVIKVRKEEGGLRVGLMYAPRPETSLRDEVKDVKTVSTWKTELEMFLADDDLKIKVFPGVIMKDEEMEYAHRIVGQVCGPMATVELIGDKLIVSKP